MAWFATIFSDAKTVGAPMSSPEIPATGASSMSYRVGDWLVDPAAGQIAKGGLAVKLEPKVMEVLGYLAHRQGELVTREDLERDVWRGAVVGYDSITAAVIKLRKALTDDARRPRYIATIPKRGYRLIAAVQDRALPLALRRRRPRTPRRLFRDQRPREPTCRDGSCRPLC